MRAFSLYVDATGQIVTAECESGGRDCDGEHRHYWTLVYDIGSADEPKWEDAGNSEYDQFAQLAGY